MPLTFRLLLAIALLNSFNVATSQGCSDAGFCTMGAMKPDQLYGPQIKIHLRSVEASQYVGLTEFGDMVVNYIGDINIGVTDNTTFQVKLPYVIVDGPLVRHQGIGDLTLSLSQNLKQVGGYQLGATVGTKIPTGKDDLRGEGNRPLPMYNQTGLGTYDLIGGLSLINEKWLFATGFQKAFGESDNTFIWGPWVGTEAEEEALAYPRALRLQRGLDVMLRAERNFRFLNWNAYLGLLPIYRLTKDQIELPILNDAGQPSGGFRRVKVDGSDGMALTLLSGVGYQFNTRSGIKALYGVRLTKRQKNPDGLSRKMVSTIGYVYRF